MAQYTNTVVLTSSWQELSAGQSTVLIQVDDQSPGRVLLAVVDTLAGDGAAVVANHYLTPVDNPVANFYNLAGKRVLGKKRVSAETPSLIVTAY